MFVWLFKGVIISWLDELVCLLRRTMLPYSVNVSFMSERFNDLFVLLLNKKFLSLERHLLFSDLFRG